MRPSPLVLVWRVTEFCDLGCHFCGFSRRLPRPRAAANAGQIMAFGAALKAYAAASGRDILVSWLGGEPLRWPPLFDISRLFKHAFDLRLGVTTNGTALDSAAVRRRLAEDFDELTISLDGLGAVHDRLRDAPGLYDRLRANIPGLRDLAAGLGRGPRLRVNTILMRDNLHAFEALCRTVAAWGVTEVTFNTLGARDRPEFYPDLALRPEEVDWFRGALPGIRTRLAGLGLTIWGSDRYLDRLARSARGAAVPIDDCRPGRQFLFIDERGLVSPCSYTAQSYWVQLSDLGAPGDLHQLPRQLTERRRKEMVAPCLDCPSTQVFGKFELI